MQPSGRIMGVVVAMVVLSSLLLLLFGVLEVQIILKRLSARQNLRQALVSSSGTFRRPKLNLTLRPHFDDDYGLHALRKGTGLSGEGIDKDRKKVLQWRKEPLGGSSAARVPDLCVNPLALLHNGAVFQEMVCC